MGIERDYETMAAEADWAGYQEALAVDGVRWSLELDQPRVEARLAPLEGLADLDLTPRLAVLWQACSPRADLARLEELCEALARAGDLEGAVVASSAGLAAIWSTGAGFEHHEALASRLVGLLATGGPPLSALARASGHCFLGTGLLLAAGDLVASAAHFERASELAAEARSTSLEVLAAVGRGYRFLYAGDLCRLEVLLVDTLPLAGRPECSPVSRSHLGLLRGLALCFQGRPEEALSALPDLAPAPPACGMPLLCWLVGQSHRLLAASLLGDQAALTGHTEPVQAHVVHERARFHQGPVHGALCIAELVAGRARTALAHADEAVRSAELTGSAHSARLAGYLRGRALVDLGQTEEAMDQLGAGIDGWIASGYALFAASAFVELAGLERRLGRVEVARGHLERAHAALPVGAEPVALFRPPLFGRSLALALEPPRSVWAVTDRPVQIEAFGPLRLRHGGASLPASGWPGVRTRALLEAVLAAGGVSVPVATLHDQLWPEAEGDRAASSLKVTLSRLRRVGLGVDGPPLPWIVSRAGTVSLDRELCAVDVLAFEDEVRRALADPLEVDALAWALRLYTADFLARDGDAPWVLARRARLRDLLAEGATALAERSSSVGRVEEHLPLLERAHATCAVSERLCSALMSAYVATGFPSEALRAFARTSAALTTLLEAAPGPRLVEQAALARAALSPG